MITSYTINSNSLEYLPVQVIANKAGSPYNPTTDSGFIAVPVQGTEPITWYSASWETIGEDYYLRILIGTGGAIALEIGKYDVYAKVDDSPETPVLPAGKLYIT